MKYIVSLGGREVEVMVDGDRIGVAGRTLTAALRPVPGTPLRQLIVDGRPSTHAIHGSGRGQWTISHRGEQWEAEVVDERTRHIRSLTRAGKRRRGPGALRAPMPGLVVRVLAEAGQRVGTGTGVIVLEAMKMENELKTSGAGMVRSVLVRPGEAVEKGQVLIEFEAERA